MPYRLKNPVHHKPGTAPGTLVKPEGAVPPRISVMAFSADAIEERDITSPDDIKPLLEKYPVTWVNVDGLGSVETMEKLGALFSLHPLAMEDVLNTAHRPKAESYGNYLFIVTRMTCPQDESGSEQVSIFIGRNFVLTFQERPGGDCLDPVRSRIRSGPGRRVRMAHADYLGYAILDTIIDGYFPVLENYGDKLDALEDEAVRTPKQDVLARTHILRRELQHIRHALWPMREIVNTLLFDDTIIQDDTKPFLRDCYDHTVHILDILEIFRERAASLIEIYLSSISNRLNDVMRVLTVISTIFMPLSFIAGVYGMNFDTSSPWNMPELHWRYGYPFVLGLMGTVAAVLLLYFWLRGWLGGHGTNR